MDCHIDECFYHYSLFYYLVFNLTTSMHFIIGHFNITHAFNHSIADINDTFQNPA